MGRVGICSKGSDREVADFSGADWRKSTHSMGAGNCVELAHLPSGEVAVRDSKNQAGPVIVLSSGQWEAFADDVRNSGCDFYFL
jgi:hypothetical protein